MFKHLKTATLVAFLVLSACREAPHSGEEPARAAASLDDKRQLVQLVSQHYLWPSTLPAKVDVDAHPSLEALLAHLTARARAEGKDRGWSRLAKSSGDGETAVVSSHPWTAVGFGASYLHSGSSILIADVVSGSAAGRAGFRRGDTLVALASSRAGLDDPANTALTLNKAGRLFLAMGPAEVGTRRFFRIQKPGGGPTVDVEAAMDRHGLDPVPGAAAPIVIPLEGGRRVGVLILRKFDRSAEDPLRRSMGSFRRAGVTDLIVDLRYNGGGSLETLKVLMNLLHPHAGPREVMFRNICNGKSPDETVHFNPEPEAFRPARIACITSRASASASEALVNGLLPYYHRNIALVGVSTAGKAVGQFTFPLPSGVWDLKLVAFRILNAEGHGDYTHGLPDPGFRGDSCLAPDDLRHPLGNPAEACTRAALRWIATGTSARGPIPARFSEEAQSNAPVSLSAEEHPFDEDMPGSF